MPYDSSTGRTIPVPSSPTLAQRDSPTARNIGAGRGRHQFFDTPNKPETLPIMAIPSVYHGDSDADDEYERSVMTSPILHTDDESSPTDTDPPSTEPTPTAFGHHIDIGKSSPGNIVLGWTTDQCADYISNLGLSQYCDNFLGMGLRLSQLSFTTLQDVAGVSMKLT